MNYKSLSILIFFLIIAKPFLLSADWPSWGKNQSRNMVSDETGISFDFIKGVMNDDESIDLSTTKNIRWVAKLGSQAYGNVTVGEGKVLVGTNNESVLDPQKQGDRGVVMCFDEKSGEFEWQLVIPKLGAGKVSDWEYIGVCSSPAIENGKAYVVTNRCEVVCLDLNGLKDGNDGVFQEEQAYIRPKGSSDPLNAQLDADILWCYDMRDELGVFPHNVTSSSALILGDRLFVATSNGVDWSHINIPSPLSPSWIALDKNTGELIGEDGSGASEEALHAAWSSLTYGNLEGKDYLYWGGTDGYLYAYANETKQNEEGFDLFNPIWKIDCNEPHYRVDKEGRKIPYATPPGPSELIATPVLYRNKIYCSIGQDPEHGDGVGRLSCVDAKSGELIWKNTDIGRTISTPSIADGLIYQAEYAGILHCLDAETGEVYWTYDSYSRIWGSTLVVDGKVLLGNEDGDLLIFEHGKEENEPKAINLGAPVYSSPVVANQTLYISTQTHLYAIGK
jgi:outer membrane protein assembly factor BamB